MNTSNRKTRVITVLASVIAVSAVSMSAHDASAGGAWSGSTQIAKLTKYSGGTDITIHSAQTVINPANCSNTAYYGMTVGLDTSTNQLFSMLMAAYLSGSSVKFKVYDSGCLGDKPHAYAVELE